jgi:phosphoserine phosphatase
MKFTIIRHGETVANTKLLLSGHRDTPLTENGLKQAHRVAERLKAERFTAAYSSDLSRAINTRDTILQHHNYLKGESLPLLRERSFGEFEEQAIATHFSALKNSGLPLWEFTPPQGESLIQVQQRATQFISSLTKDSNSHLLIVGHFSINKAIINCLLGLELQRWEELMQGNTCVNIIEIKDGAPIAHLLNCTKHLD